MIEKEILVFDSTMRDGEQQPMLSFRDDEKIALCYQLEKLGVFEIDLMPSIDHHERMLINLLNDSRLRDVLGSATMLGNNYIDEVNEINSRVSYLFVHVSDKLMQSRGKTREQNLFDIINGVKYAKSKGLIVDFCGGDGTRADEGYLNEILTEIKENIRFYQTCDTSGLMTPTLSAKHIQFLNNIIPEQVVVHFHNDNGKSVDSVVAAIKNGAIGFDGTFLGIGERAGNVATEKVIKKLQKDEHTLIKGIDYDELDNTVNMVKKMCREVSPPEFNLDRKYPNVSGIHARALLGKKDAFDYFYDEQAVDELLFFGKHSGKNNYKILFGNKYSDEKYSLMRDKVKKLSRDQLKDFTTNEIIKMVNDGTI